MPKFIVRERRARDVEYLIEATDESAARKLDGEIIWEVGDYDDYGLELLGVVRVNDDADGLVNLVGGPQ